MAKQKVGSLHAELTMNGQAYRAELKRAEDRTKRFGGSAKASFGMVAKGATVMAGVTAAAVASMVVVFRQASQRIDALAKASDKLGITTEALAGLRHAAEQTAGVTGKTLDTAIQRMVRRISEAAQGTGEAKNAIAELGLDVQKLAAMSPDQQFRAIADAMTAVKTQGDRVRLTMRLFDSEGVALVNTLAAGSQGLSKFEREAQALGIAVSRIDAAAIEQANDALDSMQKAMQGAGNTFAVAMAPSIEAAAEAAVELLSSIKPTAGEVELMGKTANAVFGTMLDGVQILVMGFSGMNVAIQSSLILLSELAKKRREAGEKLGWLGDVAAFLTPGATTASNFLDSFEMDPDETFAAIKSGADSLESIERQRREWAHETLEVKLQQIEAERQAREAAAEADKTATREAGAVAVEVSAERIRAIRAERRASMDAAHARFQAKEDEKAAEEARIAALIMQFETEEERAQRIASERIQAAWDIAWAKKRSADWAADREAEIEADLQERLAIMRGGSEEDPLAGERSELEQRLSMLQQFGIMEMEQAALMHQQRMEQIEAQLGQKAGLEAEYNAAMEAEKQRHEQEKARIERAGDAMRIAAFTGNAQAILGGFQALGNALLKDTKAFNVGMAIANTALAVTKFLSLGQVGMAVAAGLNGAAQVAAIQKAGKGTGSLPGVLGRGGSTSADQQQQGPTVLQTQSISIEVRRAAGGVSREEALSLYEALTDVARDRNDGIRVGMG